MYARSLLSQLTHGGQAGIQVLMKCGFDASD
jgi:hypothetical protein